MNTYREAVGSHFGGDAFLPESKAASNASSGYTDHNRDLYLI